MKAKSNQAGPSAEDPMRWTTALWALGKWSWEAKVSACRTSRSLFSLRWMARLSLQLKVAHHFPLIPPCSPQVCQKSTQTPRQECLRRVPVIRVSVSPSYKEMTRFLKRQKTSEALFLLFQVRKREIFSRLLSVKHRQMSWETAIRLVRKQNRCLMFP